jgi:hypothetical protein
LKTILNFNSSQGDAMTSSLLSDPTACARAVLAQGPHCRIELCHCGTLHVTVGPVTFRTSAEVAGALLGVLADALGRMPDKDTSAPTRAGWPLVAGKPGAPS